jgi:hypothetical protein
MIVEVVKVLAPFIFFAWIFNVRKAHNMMALMFDPRYKGFSCVCEFVD